MPLGTGTKVGAFEVVAKLGEGGMGEVYRARDLKLNRDVAIKILPPHLAGDRDRLLRFEREAQSLAALNHPNIAQIFGVIEEPAALVMEFVPGRTLEELIAGADPATASGLRPEDAIPLALQIARALEAAHEQGIVHRDLKPANVKVRDDGMVKVLDFGLARMAGQGGGAEIAPADSATRLSPAMTHHGLILGTAGYMSPEQARGRRVDKRADIWAFGVVLFEMLAGGSPFATRSASDSTETVTEIIARVIEREPEWSLLPATTPLHLRDVIARCLVKDPQRRLRDIGEARIALESPDAGTPGRQTATAQSGRPARAGWLPPVAALLVGALALAAWQMFGAGPSASGPAAVRRLRVSTPVATVPAGSNFSAVISPDGEKIAMFTNTGVTVRWLADGRTNELVKNDDVRQVFWSPDSRWVGFATVSEISKVSLDGGAPFLMASLRGVPGPFNLGAGNVAWFPGDRLVFTTGFSGLMEVRPPDTKPVQIVPPESETMDFHGAHALPDGGVLTSIHEGDAIDRFEVVRGNVRKEVFRDPGARLGMPIYSSTGHLLFPRSGGNPGIWALPFDVRNTKVTGTPFLVIDGAFRPSVSADGQLLIGAPVVPAAKGKITLMKFDGTIERSLSPDVTGRLHHPAWSPDGQRVLVPLQDAPDPGARSSLFALSADGRNAAQLTSGIDVSAGRFFPDGGRLLIETGGPLCMSGDCFSIGWKALQDERIHPIVRGVSGDLSPDGKTLVYSGRVAGAEWDLFTVPVDGGEAVPFQGGVGWQIGARFSPDGNWIAYVSTESGRPEIWVASYPAGGKWRVAQDAGYWPRWIRDGAGLAFARGTSVASVAFTPGTTPSFSMPFEMLPPGTLMEMQTLRIPYAFDVTPDGQRIVVVKDPQTAATMTLEVLQGWDRK